MKTAISVPDDTYRAVTDRAAELGMSRSEFFTRAAREYLDRLDQARLTDQINAALGEPGTDDSNDVAVEASRRLLRDGDW